jgi:N6-adenosine-specific RNA methylase IME4
MGDGYDPRDDAVKSDDAAIEAKRRRGDHLKGMTRADTRRIDSIIIGPRFRKDHGDIAGLAASIEAVGLLQAVVVTADNRLVAGERRLRACQTLGWTDIPVRIVDLENLITGEAAENFERKDFTLSEAVAIKRALEPDLRHAAAARQAAGTRVQSLHKGRTRETVAAFTGFSHETLRKAEAVVAAAEAQPERYRKLVDDMDRTGRADGVWRRLSNIRQAESLRAAPPPLPGGPFTVIVADPPWPYEEDMPDPSGRGILPYPTMGIAEIRALPVSELADENCIVWLWATNLLLANGAVNAVLGSWGFQPKSILSWVKPRLGNGYWLRGQTEHAVMATRGKPVVTLTNQSTVLHATSGVQHSGKPDAFYALVQSLCPAPPGGYLEMFARKARPGWTVWGDEAPVASVEGNAR